MSGQLWWEKCEAAWSKPRRPTGATVFATAVAKMTTVFVVWFAAIRLTSDAGAIYNILVAWGLWVLFGWVGSLIVLLAYAISKAGDDR